MQKNAFFLVGFIKMHDSHERLLDEKIYMSHIFIQNF